MTNAVIECILSRTTTKYYDPAATLSDDQIRDLVRIGTTALYVANHGETATDAYVWERRLGLSVIDELIALVAFIGAVLLLIQIY